MKQKNACDRCPGIKSAGKPTKHEGETVSQCMIDIGVEDIVNAVIKALPKNEKLTHPKITPTPNPNYFGVNTEVSKLLSPPKKTFFQELKDELKETAYKSYWTNELGKLPDQVPGLPFGTDPANHTFGKPSVKEDNLTAKEVVNPPKCPHIVEQEGIKGNELYKISHNSDFVGVQKRVMPEEFQNQIYGKKTPKLLDGGSMKLLLRWIDQSEVSATSQNLAFFKYRNHPEIGRPLNRLDIETLYKVCLNHGLDFNKEQIGPLCIKLNIFDDSTADYLEFANLINPRSGLPTFPKVEETNRKKNDYLTTYKFMCQEPEKTITGKRNAGLPSVRSDNGYVRVPKGMCKAHIQDLPEETAVAEVISPPIYLHYGLSHRDFFMPRTKEYFKDLLSRLNFEVSEEKFDNLWQEGFKMDNSDGVCVDTFCKLLDKI